MKKTSAQVKSTKPARCAPYEEILPGGAVIPNLGVISSKVSRPFSRLRQLMPPLAYEGETDGSGEPHGTGTITHPFGLKWSGRFEHGHFREGRMYTYGCFAWEGPFVNIYPHIPEPVKARKKHKGNLRGRRQSSPQTAATAKEANDKAQTTDGQ